MKEKLNVEICEITSDEMMTAEGGYKVIERKNSVNAAIMLSAIAEDALTGSGRYSVVHRMQ